ncbi:GspH/FimT family pseudopilin [Thermodesulfobacteriota bacterium B35]
MRLLNEKGFSVLEVFTVVAIILIMAAVGVSGFGSWLPNIRLKAAGRDLYSALMKAKGEAVKRNRNFALTFNQQVGGVLYSYIVYEDADADCEYDPGETIVMQVRQWPENVSLDSTQGGGDGLSFTNNDDGNPTIAFRPTAIPTQNGGGFANGTAFLRNSSGRNLNVIVSRAGNISISN